MKAPSAQSLLAWYDRHRRELPWRAEAGEIADPYRVWLSEIMLQQTTVASVKPYFERFTAEFPTVESLAAAPSEAVMRAWAGLGYYSRARNLHACAKAVVAEHGGLFPVGEAELLTLPGIGPYTAAAITAIAFNRHAAAVDGNVERVMSRILRLEAMLPGARPAIKAATLALVPPDRPGDFAQALMDLGATICTPKSPSCLMCPWQECCRARAAGDQAGFPRKAAKSAKATRYGIAFVALRSGNAVLLRTRPPKGLLGGMAEVPTSDWTAREEGASSNPQPPFPGSWITATDPVRHVFTHFPLELDVYALHVASDVAAPEGMRFTRLEALGSEPLSTLMRKVIEAGLEALEIRS
jgi:A/G-specific adenine glycosylase